MQYMKFRRLKQFRLKKQAVTSFQTYMKHLKHLMSDRILRKRLVVAKVNDQSMFDSNGDLLPLDDDSVLEHNFFEVHATVSKAINYEKNPDMEGWKASSSQLGLGTGISLTKCETTSVKLADD